MTKKEDIHVVMLPWLAFGHMIPFLELSIALAKLNIHVSFLSTPKNIQRLPKIPTHLSQFIDFVSIPMPKLDSNPLPENAEATIDIPVEKMNDLKIACDLLKQPIKSFIDNTSPDWIIVDFCYHWAADFNTPLIFFSVITASSGVFFWSHGDDGGESGGQHKVATTPQDWEVAFKDAGSNFFDANATDGMRTVRLVRASRAIVVRTCMEFEGEYVKIYSKITGRPVIPVGVLPPEKPERKNVEEKPWSTIFDWLDRNNTNSVVFVGFGSETKLNKEQIHEIAYGLELSGLPFLWSLRVDNDDDDSDTLPPGFSARTAGQGVVNLGWAPQKEIFAHPSIGGSFFHAGWGSIIEAMQYGHVLVFLPSIIDQPLNARLMVEKGLGIEVKRAEDGSFTRNDVAFALTKAMVSSEGKEIRARAEDATSTIFANHELHANYIEKFAEYLSTTTPPAEVDDDKV